MGSTGEPDRKRRHFSAVSPTSAAKKNPLLPSSEDKKLDTAVLQYQNKKLVQQLEAQKSVFCALESKFSQVEEKQHNYDDTLVVVNRSWDQLVDNLESVSIRGRGSSNGKQDEASCSPAESFLSRLLETGATDSSTVNGPTNQIDDRMQTAHAETKNILQNILLAISDLWHENEQIHDALRGTLPEDEAGKQLQNTSNDLEMEVKNLRRTLSDLHLKHRSLSNEVQSSRDNNAKNKAELKCLTGELEGTIAELEENNFKLATLKSLRDAAQGASFPVLNLGNKHVSGDRAGSRLKASRDMESAFKEFSDLASTRLLELKSAHEERIEILRQLAVLQNSLKNMKHISSSKSYLLLNDQLEKSKADVEHYQALLEKLQVEKDTFVWKEREVNLKVDLADVSRRVSAIADSRMVDLEKDLQKRIDERNLLETRLEDASKEPGRKEIISEFKVMVSKLHKDMGLMQSQLSKYKEAAFDIHSLRAEVQSLSNVLSRKANELEALSSRSADHLVEIQKLQAVVLDLKESDRELKLILEMYRRESSDPRDVVESRDMEYKAWAHVQSLKSALDDHSLELRVKAANEAEAISQQKLATAEAQIADLRQKLKVSVRNKSHLDEVLKSTNEEGEAYLSEIETIGQAYEDMQTQNQQLLQQITERDDYNIKLVLEGVKARQMQDALHMEKETMEKEVLHANSSLDFYKLKAARVEDQVKICSELIGKLAEDGWQSSNALESSKKRLFDLQKESQQLRQSLDESQSKVEKSRLDVTELQIELEKQRFSKRRIEEELEVVTRKATRLREHTDGSSVLDKLQQEIKEYKAILKCGICHDRPKEVVITKCYHLFCHPCVQKILDSRHRKCSACGTSFGPNDVRNVYL